MQDKKRYVKYYKYDLLYDEKSGSARSDCTGGYQRVSDKQEIDASCGTGPDDT